MTKLKDMWRITRKHLHCAGSIADLLGSEDYREYLNHNELELAADVLMEEALERGEQPFSFWEALHHAYDNMKLEDKAQRCAARMKAPDV